MRLIRARLTDLVAPGKPHDGLHPGGVDATFSRLLMRLLVSSERDEIDGVPHVRRQMQLDRPSLLESVNERPRSIYHKPKRAYGISTVSITWMTPLDVMTSAVVTLALLIITPSAASIFTLPPCTVPASLSLTTSFAVTLPATTW